jgi:hypothetical protein
LAPGKQISFEVVFVGVQEGSNSGLLDSNVITEVRKITAFHIRSMYTALRPSDADHAPWFIASHPKTSFTLSSTRIDSGTVDPACV